MSENIKENENIEVKDSETIKANKKKAKKKIGIVILVVIILGVLYGGYYFLYGSSHESTDNAYVTGDQTTVTAQISGRVTGINFIDTKEVKKGDLLIQFEDTDYKLDLERAELTLAQATRKYSSLNTNVAEYQHALIESENLLTNTKSNYERNEKSYKVGIISRKHMDDSTTELKNAQQLVKQRKDALENAKLQAKSEDIYSHPDIKNAILEYKQAYLNLSRTKIYAPVNGVIGKKSIFVGEKVEIGHPLFSVVDLENEWVEVNLKENQMENLKIGNVVELTSNLNGKKYKGYVTGIEAGTGNAFSLLPPQNATGNWIKITQRVPVRVSFDKEDLKENGLLPLGTTMDAVVSTEKIEKNLPTVTYQTSDPYTLDNKEIQEKIDYIIKRNTY